MLNRKFGLQNRYAKTFILKLVLWSLLFPFVSFFILFIIHFLLFCIEELRFPSSLPILLFLKHLKYSFYLPNAFLISLWLLKHPLKSYSIESKTSRHRSIFDFCWFSVSSIQMIFSNSFHFFNFFYQSLYFYLFHHFYLFHPFLNLLFQTV